MESALALDCLNALAHAHRLTLFRLLVRAGDEGMAVGELAEATGMAGATLTNHLNILRRAGLVKSLRGPQGGHILSRPPSQITLSEAMAALEGSTAPMSCAEDDLVDCPLIASCVLRPVWQRLKEATDNVLRGTTLADLCEQYREQEEQVMYHI